MTPQRFLDVLKRRSIVAWSVLAVGLGLIYSLRNMVPESFLGVSHVVLVADTGARDPSVSINDLPSIATSTVVLQRVRNSLHLPMSLVSLKADVSASVLGRSSIMAIAFRNQAADRAIAVSNAIADELSRYYDEISTQRYDVNVDRLSAQLSVESQKIRELDQQMSGVLGTNPFVVSDQSINNLTSQLQTLNVQRAEAYATLQGDRAIAASLAPNVELSKTARHEILANDPTYNAIRSVAAKDSAELASYRAGYTAAFPGLPGAVERVSTDMSVANKIAAAALSDPDAFSPSAAATASQRIRQLAVVAGDEVRLQQIDQLIDTQKSNLHQIPTTGKTYDELRAERDALRTEYTALATRRANAVANRAEASSLGSVVVLDRAIKADTQLAGGRTRAEIVALLLVIACAIGAAFLVESLDPRIRRAEEVEGLYGIPVVAKFGARA